MPTAAAASCVGTGGAAQVVASAPRAPPQRPGGRFLHTPHTHSEDRATMPPDGGGDLPAAALLVLRDGDDDMHPSMPHTVDGESGGAGEEAAHARPVGFGQQRRLSPVRGGGGGLGDGVRAFTTVPPGVAATATTTTTTTMAATPHALANDARIDGAAASPYDIGLATPQHPPPADDPQPVYESQSSAMAPTTLAAHDWYPGYHQPVLGVAEAGGAGGIWDVVHGPGVDGMEAVHAAGAAGALAGVGGGGGRTHDRSYGPRVPVLTYGDDFTEAVSGGSARGWEVPSTAAGLPGHARLVTPASGHACDAAGSVGAYAVVAPPPPASGVPSPSVSPTRPPAAVEGLVPLGHPHRARNVDAAIAPRPPEVAQRSHALLAATLAEVQGRGGRPIRDATDVVACASALSPSKRTKVCDLLDALQHQLREEVQRRTQAEAAAAAARAEVLRTRDEADAARRGVDLHHNRMAAQLEHLVAQSKTLVTAAHTSRDLAHDLAARTIVESEATGRAAIARGYDAFHDGCECWWGVFATAREERRSLIPATHHIQTLHEVRATAAQHAEGLHVEITGLRNELDTAWTALAEKNAEIKAKTDDAQLWEGRARREKAEGERAVAQLKEQHVQEIEVLRDSHAAHVQEMEDARGALEAALAAKKAEEVAKAEDAVQHLTQNNAFLQRTVSALQSKHADLLRQQANHATVVDTLEAEKLDLVQQHQDERRSLIDMHQSEVNGILNSFEEEAARSVASDHTLRSTLTDLEAKLDNAEARTTAFNTQLTASRKECHAKEQQYQEERTRRSQLSEAEAACRAELAALRKEHDLVISEVDSLRSSYADARASLTKQKEAASKEHANLRACLSRADSQLASVTSGFEAEKSRAKRYRQQYTSVKKRIKRAASVLATASGGGGVSVATLLSQIARGDGDDEEPEMPGDDEIDASNTSRGLAAPYPSPSSTPVPSPRGPPAVPLPLSKRGGGAHHAARTARERRAGAAGDVRGCPAAPESVDALLKEHHLGVAEGEISGKDGPFIDGSTALAGIQEGVGKESSSTHRQQGARTHATRTTHTTSDGRPPRGSDAVMVAPDADAGGSGRARDHLNEKCTPVADLGTDADPPLAVPLDEDAAKGGGGDDGGAGAGAGVPVGRVSLPIAESYDTDTGSATAGADIDLLFMPGAGGGGGGACASNPPKTMTASCPRTITPYTAVTAVSSAGGGSLLGTSGSGSRGGGDTTSGTGTTPHPVRHGGNLRGDAGESSSVPPSGAAPPPATPVGGIVLHTDLVVAAAQQRISGRHGSLGLAMGVPVHPTAGGGGGGDIPAGSTTGRHHALFDMAAGVVLPSSPAGSSAPGGSPITRGGARAHEVSSPVCHADEVDADDPQVGAPVEGGGRVRHRKRRFLGGAANSDSGASPSTPGEEDREDDDDDDTAAAPRTAHPKPFTIDDTSVLSTVSGTPRCSAAASVSVSAASSPRGKPAARRPLAVRSVNLSLPSLTRGQSPSQSRRGSVTSLLSGLPCTPHATGASGAGAVRVDSDLPPATAATADEASPPASPRDEPHGVTPSPRARAKLRDTAALSAVLSAAIEARSSASPSLSSRQQSPTAYTPTAEPGVGEFITRVESGITADGNAGDPVSAVEGGVVLPIPTKTLSDLSNECARVLSNTAPMASDLAGLVLMARKQYEDQQQQQQQLPGEPADASTATSASSVPPHSTGWRSREGGGGGVGDGHDDVASDPPPNEPLSCVVLGRRIGSAAGESMGSTRAFQSFDTRRFSQFSLRSSMGKGQHGDGGEDDGRGEGADGGVEVSADAPIAAYVFPDADKSGVSASASASAPRSQLRSCTPPRSPRSACRRVSPASSIPSAVKSREVSVVSGVPAVRGGARGAAVGPAQPRALASRDDRDSQAANKATTDTVDHSSIANPPAKSAPTSGVSRAPSFPSSRKDTSAHEGVARGVPCEDAAAHVAGTPSIARAPALMTAVTASTSDVIEPVSEKGRGSASTRTPSGRGVSLITSCRSKGNEDGTTGRHRGMLSLSSPVVSSAVTNGREVGRLDDATATTREGTPHRGTPRIESVRKPATAAGGGGSACGSPVPAVGSLVSARSEAVRGVALTSTSADHPPPGLATAAPAGAARSPAQHRHRHAGDVAAASLQTPTRTPTHPHGHAHAPAGDAAVRAYLRRSVGGSVSPAAHPLPTAGGGAVAVVAVPSPLRASLPTPVLTPPLRAAAGRLQSPVRMRTPTLPDAGARGGSGSAVAAAAAVSPPRADVLPPLLRSPSERRAEDAACFNDPHFAQAYFVGLQSAAEGKGAGMALPPAASPSALPRSPAPTSSPAFGVAAIPAAPDTDMGEHLASLTAALASLDTADPVAAGSGGSAYAQSRDEARQVILRAMGLVQGLAHADGAAAGERSWH